MAERVRLYEDIDGCLNASHNGRPWRTSEDYVNAGYCRGRAKVRHDDRGVEKPHSDISYLMEWNSRVIDELNTLPLDFAWLTTWRADAMGVGELMGLTLPQRVLHPLNGKTTFPSIDWKYESVRAEQEPDPSPFIWVDDELGDIPQIAIDYMVKDLGGLLIAPDPNFGITPHHISMMREYIARF